MKKLLFILFVPYIFIFGSDYNAIDNVDLLSGQLCYKHKDLTVEAPEPLVIERTYKANRREDLFFPHLILDNGLSPSKSAVIRTSEPDGKKIIYSEKNKKLFIANKSPKFTNCVNNTLSGKNNPLNNYIKAKKNFKQMYVYCPDGSIRIYKDRYHGERKYLLAKEIFANGQMRTYEYNKRHKLTLVRMENPTQTVTYAWAKFSYAGTVVTVETSDNQKIVYHLHKAKRKENDEYAIDYVETEGLKIKHHYDPSKKEFLLQSVEINGHPTFFAEYDKAFLSHLKLYTNSDKTPETFRTYSYSYKKTVTESKDSNGRLTKTYFDKDQKIIKKEEYNLKNQLHSVLVFNWEGPNLKKKILSDGAGKKIFSRIFSYDDKGNVLEDLYIDHVANQKYKKTFSYSNDGKNHILKEQDDKTEILYKYLGETDLVTKKIQKNGPKIFLRSFYEYDKNNLLSAEIIDDGTTHEKNNLDGVTERKILRIERSDKNHLPCCLKSYYWDEKEILLKKQNITYNKKNQVIREDLFDENDQFVYSIHKRYDQKGNLIEETDPLGRTGYYTYDHMNRILTENPAGKCFSYAHTYDLAGRRIQTEKIDLNDQRQTFKTGYNIQGQITYFEDEQGNIKENVYDEFGNCIETKYPQVFDENGISYHPTLKYGHNIQGNVTEEFDSKGSCVKTVYNALGDALKIEHPDHTVTKNRYNPDGTIAEKTLPGQSVIQYRYDPQQRLIEKSYFSNNQFAGKESWEYNSFHLLCHTDIEGKKTSYIYDKAGREIEENNNGIITQFTYDSLGRKNSVYSPNSDVKKEMSFDLAGRKIYERIIEPGNKIENEVKFTINDYDQITQVDSNHSIDQIQYDGKGRKIRHINPSNAEIKILYEDHYINAFNQKVLKKTTIQPNGLKIIEIEDALTRTAEIEKRTPSDECIHHEKFFYDKRGNKSKSLITVYQNNQPIRTIENVNRFDTMHRVISKTEGKTKTTLFSYDEKGRETIRTKPDGTKIYFFYDERDRVLELKASDHSIHYQYTYERWDQPVQIKDMLTGKTYRFEYDNLGRLIFEKNGSEITMQWSYDKENRPLEIKLPDQSSITYTYEGSHLKKIQRPSYEHEYVLFNEKGLLAKEKLPFNSGFSSILYDECDRPIQYQSPWHEIRQTYTKNNEIETIDSTILGRFNYSHNLLSQLTAENKKNYEYDSIGNPAEIPVNDLNEFQKDEYQYDPNGNLIKKDDCTFSYDALDRLVKIDGSVQIEYTYDPLNRIETKKTPNKTLYFIHNHNFEIGTFSNGKIQELKVIGNKEQTIAVEIENEIFVPVHDFRNNIIALLSPEEKDIVQTYVMDAFGREEQQDFLTPWRFSSKRHDESGLVYFRHRFYDPSLKRWLTPDPAGNVDGPNLYAYVLNNPLNRLDLWGLESKPIKYIYNEPNPFHNMTIDLKPFMNIKNYTEGVKLLRECISPNLVCLGNTKHYLTSNVKETYDAKERELINFYNHPVPKSDKPVILNTVTINGINVSNREFNSYVETKNNALNNKVLNFGLYNISQGLTIDFQRLEHEFMGNPTNSIERTKAMLVFTSKMSELKMGEKGFTLYEVHSEGSTIIHHAINGLPEDMRKLVEKHTLIIALGPTTPIPKSLIENSINIHSDKDWLTLHYSNRIKNKNDYIIDIVPCISPTSQKTFWLCDHAYLGNTYQEASKEAIKTLKKEFNFFEYKK